MAVSIQMLGSFQIEADGVVYDNLATRSRRGVNLIEYLVLQRGRPVSSQRLNRDLWTGRHIESPEGALKTLVSRTRAMLNEISPGLGGCIVSGTGGYRWESQPGVSVDVLRVIAILESLERAPQPEARRALTEELVELYKGDLEDAHWLHSQYLEAVYAYVELLRESEAYNRICEVCRKALEIDDLDDQLHILLMDAMVNLNRPSEAMSEYKKVVRRSQRYLDAEPSEDLRESYSRLVEEGKSLKFNLDVIHNELTREEKELSGPYFCDYRAFKEIYNIQIRNLERLSSTMFLGVIMLVSTNTVAREGGMAGLLEILRNNLRKGDIVTRFSDDIVAMLLPTVNYKTGGVVIERIERLFYGEYQASNVVLHARISPLGGRA